MQNGSQFRLFQLKKRVELSSFAVTRFFATLGVSDQASAFRIS